MPLHLVKLCVGAHCVQDLSDWIEERRRSSEARGEAYEHRHTTRMVPKRADEILEGGSLYWVVKGVIEVRQRLVAIRPFTDADGIGRCHLVLDPVLVLTAPRPMRPFQGWRYLGAAQAPLDLAEAGGSGDLPDHLRRELAQLGLM